jgi:hypothetical protein
VFGLGLVAVIAVLVLVFSSAGGAHIKIHPRQERVAIDAIYSAKKTPAQNELAFEVVTIDTEASQPVKASGEEDVSRKASGTVVIYNNYSADNQTLIINTRLETADGLIYRIPSAIVVPGYKVVSGKNVPGSIELKVTADQPGEKYNIASGDFTIPGFKGDPRFEKFSAKSKGPFTGGFVGKEKKIADADLLTAKQTLHTKLDEELKQQIRAQLPPNFILYEDGSTISYESRATKTVDASNAEVVEKGTLNAVVFDRQQLVRTIALSKGATDNPSFVGIENLSFEMLSKASTTLPSAAEITFKLVGEGTIVWGYNAGSIKQDLAGKNKTELVNILSKYPNIEKAEAILKPFWTRSFPADIAKITIEDIIDAN